MIYITKYINKIIGLLYPSRCPYCGKVISFDDSCCPKCRTTLPIILRIRIIDTFENKEVPCLSVFAYHSEAKYAIWEFKFRSKSYFSTALGAEMIKALKSSEIFNRNYDIVTTVPLSFSRYIERGYNQSALLAKEISQGLKIPYKRLIRKKRNNMIQHELSREQRIQNVKGVYEAVNVNKIKGKTILLCDDIVTTGSTLGECAKVLYKAGAKEVFCVALADASKNLELIEEMC